MIVWSVNTLNFFLGFAPHDYLFPFVPTKTALHIEASSLFGAILGNKSAKTVLFDNAPAVQYGYDVGFLIPHYNVLPPFPPNTLLLKIIPFSSAKVIFARATVLLEGTPAAIHLPLLLCGDPIKVPTGFIVDSLRNTVIFSFDPGDVARGIGALVWENVRSFVLGHVAKKAGGEKLGKWLQDKLARYTRGASFTLWESLLKWPVFRRWEHFPEFVQRGLGELHRSLGQVERTFGQTAWKKLIEKIPMMEPEQTKAPGAGGQAGGPT